MAGIYIHIPFCKKLCHYCDFYHKIPAGGETAVFMKALADEADLRSDYLGNEKIDTIYIGGGTPSVLPVADIGHFLDKLFITYEFGNSPEITIELNPDDIDAEYVNGLKQTRVNRISMGIQSWNDNDLILLNRRHDSAQAEKALNNIFDAGFNNVSIDLIYGLPGMNPESWALNLAKSFSFDIKHLSAYHLTVEPGTVFGRRKAKGQFTETGEEESAAEFALLVEMAEKNGFVQYEISNFALNGFLSVHNTNYWRQVNYLGLGPSAHSYNGYSRSWNISDAGSYVKAINAGTILFEQEELDTKTKFNEYIMTSLRTMWGIDLEYIEKTFNKEGFDFVINISGKFRQYGLMKLEKNALVLTNQGKMISDNIISDFMMV